MARGLAQEKQLSIVFPSGGAQSASRQSRARAGDRRRHATASGSGVGEGLNKKVNGSALLDLNPDDPLAPLVHKIAPQSAVH